MPDKEFTDPHTVLDRLLEGNERFVNDVPQHLNQDSSRRRVLAANQAPFATLFGCADSRVAAEMIFDVGLGEMFVVRTAGQVTDGPTIGSLEYGVAVLGTPLLIVLGHDSCGAVTAATETFATGSSPGGFISDVVTQILPSVVHAQSKGIHDVNGTVVQNTIDTVHNLYDRSKILSAAVDEGRLVILGMNYHLANGRVNIDVTLPATAVNPPAQPASGS